MTKKGQMWRATNARLKNVTLMEGHNATANPGPSHGPQHAWGEDDCPRIKKEINILGRGPPGKVVCLIINVTAWGLSGPLHLPPSSSHCSVFGYYTVLIHPVASPCVIRDDCFLVFWKAQWERLFLAQMPALSLGMVLLGPGFRPRLDRHTQAQALLTVTLGEGH